MADVDFDAPVALPAPDSIAVQQDAGSICIEGFTQSLLSYDIANGQWWI